MTIRSLFAASALAWLAACSPPQSSAPLAPPPPAGPDATPASEPAAAPTPAPGSSAPPSGDAPTAPAPTAPPSPADGGTVSEAPFKPTSPQGAANVVQTYYALIEAKAYARAWRLWGNGGQASNMSRDAFAASFDDYAEYHAKVGAPGRAEGAAGSTYVEVPVEVYGRKKQGKAFNRPGKVTLRRVNDVPGSTAEQRAWHIERIELKP